MRLLWLITWIIIVSWLLIKRRISLGRPAPDTAGTYDEQQQRHKDSRLHCMWVGGAHLWLLLWRPFSSPPASARLLNYGNLFTRINWLVQLAHGVIIITIGTAHDDQRSTAIISCRFHGSFGICFIIHIHRVIVVTCHHRCMSFVLILAMKTQLMGNIFCWSAN